jgi:hypothetical protein
MQYWRQTIENVKDFTGTSPPSIFVGHSFYPKVFVGILSPPEQKDSSILDSPENWYRNQASINQILGYRSELIYSRFKSDIKNPKGKFLEVAQEISVAKNPTNVEIELKNNPSFTFSFDPWSTPIGNPAPLLKVQLTENPRIENKVERIVGDVDLKANSAVRELHRLKIPVSRIEKIFSAGMVGMKIQRKLVPTRWGITAVDDIIGKNILSDVKYFQELGEFRLFFNEYIGNRYFILLIPEPYQYELVEVKHPKSVWNPTGTHPSISADYEPFWGRKTYAYETGGAFYAARLAVMEHLRKIKRQAAVLIVREVTEQYFAPMGIWQMRETVRDAFNKPFEKFSDIKSAINAINNRTIIKDAWMPSSRLIKNLKEQKKLTAFSVKKSFLL